MFKTLLVAVDGSPFSDKALDVAVDLAGRYDSRLLLLTVYRHHSPLEASVSMVRPGDLPPPDQVLKDYAKEVVGAARERTLKAGAKDVQAFTKRGQPARAIVAFAEEHAVDAIVVGARGLGDIGGFLLGSVSHKVSSLSPVTCITVK